MGSRALAIAPNADADDTTLDVDSRKVQTDVGSDQSATLIDPSDSLGNVTQVAGVFESAPFALDQSESVQVFDLTYDLARSKCSLTRQRRPVKECLASPRSG